MLREYFRTTLADETARVSAELACSPFAEIAKLKTKIRFLLVVQAILVGGVAYLFGRLFG